MDYDDWKSGWYESSREYDPYEEYIAKTDLPDLEAIKDSFAEIVKRLYTDAPLDIAKLDDEINYIAEALKVKMPDGDPLIRRQTEQDSVIYSENFAEFVVSVDLTRMHA